MANKRDGKQPKGQHVMVQVGVVPRALAEVINIISQLEKTFRKVDIRKISDREGS